MKHSFQHPFGERTGFPPPPQSAPSDGHGLAVAALVLGILSLLLFCCGWGFFFLPLFVSVLAIAFSVASRRLSRRFSGQAIAGLILAILSLVLIVLLVSAIIWFFSLSEAAQRAFLGNELYRELFTVE